MNNIEVLRLLSYCNDTIRLRKILDLLKMTRKDNNFANGESMRISIIQILNNLISKVYVNKQGKLYNITNSGLKYLAFVEAESEIERSIFEKVT